MGNLLELINLNSMLYYLINFIVLAVAARFLLYKPVIRFIDGRAQKMTAQRESLESLRQELAHKEEELGEQCNARLREAEAEAGARLASADADARRILEHARAEAEKLHAAALRDAENESRKAREALRDEAVALSVQLASRILAREIRAEDHRLLVNEFLDKVG